MTPKRPVLNMHNDLTNGKVQVFSDKQKPTDMYTIVSFVIQSRQSVGRRSNLPLASC